MITIGTDGISGQRMRQALTVKAEIIEFPGSRKTSIEIFEEHKLLEKFSVSWLKTVDFFNKKREKALIEIFRMKNK